MICTVAPVSVALSASVTVMAGSMLVAAACSAKASGPLTGVTTGASLRAFTVMVNICGADESTPPLAVPPLSWTATSNVALPVASAAGV